jgi:hypothetical protein
MHDANRHIAVTISAREPQAFAKGGLARAANSVAKSGRYGDDMVIHVNRDEFQQLRKEWGEPTINPSTGMPEFFLSGIRKWFSDNPWASVALPAATSLLGVGNFLGSGVNEALGGTLSPTLANSLGSALTGGGIGALTGGGQGALTGALIGGATPLVSNFLTGGDGRGLLGGLFGSGGSEGVLGNLGGVSGGDSATNANNFTTSNNPLSGPASTTSASGALGGLGGGIGNLLTSKNAIPLAIGALALASGFAGKKPSAAAQAAAAQNSAAQAAFNRPLASNVTFDRAQVPLTAEEAMRYGTRGGRQQFTQNRLPAVAAARGGLSQAAPMMPPVRPAGTRVKGPGDGRADTIPAYLSNDEYVMDAESVALLGNGSPDAGAKKLDQLREGLRAHKGKALSRGKISPDAKDPHHYMKGGRK